MDTTKSARCRVQIKICCIASVAEAELAIASGADVLGLVSAMPSGPGVIDEGCIAAILGQVQGRVKTFLLAAAQRWQPLFELHLRCPADALQLVDSVPIEDLQMLRRRLPTTALVQVIHVSHPSAIAEAIAVAPWVDAILLDSGNPDAAIKELGGTGRTHDWRISRQIRDQSSIPVYLAGGLNPGNAADAIAAVAPYGLDICTGVRSDGVLDADKLRRFIAAAQ